MVLLLLLIVSVLFVVNLLNKSFPMAILVFFTAAARAGIVTSYFPFHPHRGVGLLLAVGAEVLVAGLHLAHVVAALYGTLRLASLIQVDE